MNREIKFRAWLQGKHDSINFDFDGFMDYDVTIQNGQWCSVESGWDIQGQYKSIPLMQFTGLKDKNGKEIYEGDVVCITSIDGKFKIIFDEWYAAFYAVNMGYSDKNKNPQKCFNLMRSNEYFEVIGNIYDNPELLGV